MLIPKNQQVNNGICADNDLTHLVIKFSQEERRQMLKKLFHVVDLIPH